MQRPETLVSKFLDLFEETSEKHKINTANIRKKNQWEYNRERVKERLRDLPIHLRSAVDLIQIEKKVGRPKELDLYTRTMLFLYVRILNKSNRDIENLMVLFNPLFEINVSYKAIERLYSDEEVQLALYNLLRIMLANENISADLSGDGTGYSILVTHHYRSNPHKSDKKYMFSFRIIDIKTGLYVGFGYSTQSEMHAFNKAMKMVKDFGIKMDSISLDRYYSSKKVLKMFEESTAVFVIPKKNITHISPQWKRTITRFFEDPEQFVSRYYLRNLSEAGFSSDKRRFGWQIRQRREDRRDSALFSIGLLHNLFFVRGIP